MLTAGAGADVGTSTAGAAAGVSAFLQAANAMTDPTVAAITAARMRVLISSPYACASGALLGNPELPARLDHVRVLHHVSVRFEDPFPGVRVPVELLGDLREAVAALDHVDSRLFRARVAALRLGRGR